MELLYPSKFMVFPTKVDQGLKRKVLNFFAFQRNTIHYLSKNSLNTIAVHLKMVQLFQSMIRKAATIFMEICHPFFKSHDQILIGFYVDSGHLAQLFQICSVGTIVLNSIYLIWSKGWQHFWRSIFFCHTTMMC